MQQWAISRKPYNYIDSSETTRDAPLLIKKDEDIVRSLMKISGF